MYSNNLFMILVCFCVLTSFLSTLFTHQMSCFVLIVDIVISTFVE